MVLHHILNHSGFFIESPASSDSYVFPCCYLNAVDKISVPDRLKPRVGKPKHKHVLNGFLPKKMINPVNLLLLSYIMYPFVYFYRSNPAIPERLFNYNSSPACSLSAGKDCGLQ